MIVVIFLELVLVFLDLLNTIERDVLFLRNPLNQVNTIKKYLSEIGLTVLPIVDTVERVQGITVDIVIFSVCTTDSITLKSKKDFIFSPNRINVAISRARVKAIIFGKFPFLKISEK